MKQLHFCLFFLFFILIRNSVSGQSDDLSIARELYRNSEYSGAIEILKDFKADAKDAAYFELLAASYFHSGDVKSAHREAHEVPDSISTSGLLSLKARIAFGRNDYESAYRYYLNLLQSDSLNSNYIRQLGVCADKLDSTEMAISYYRKALDLNPADLVSGMQLLDKYAKTDNLILADSLSLKLLAIDSLPALLRMRGDILYRLKEYETAWQCYEPLLRKGTSNPDLLRKAGVCKFATGETEMAITLLSTSHLLEPDDEITCYYLAMAYQSKPDYKNSELYFKAAISNGISQNISNYYQRMGDMYETGGNYAKALEAFQMALKYRGENDKLKPDLHYQVGRLYEVYFEDYKSAIRHYENFLKTYPDTADYKYIGIKNRKENLEKQMK